MRPNLPFLYSPNMRLSNAVFACNFNIWSRVNSNRSNSIVRQFGVFSFHPVFATMLLNAITIVLKLCSKSEMVWIYACRIVAKMHDHHAFWNRTNSPFVHNTVGASGFFARKQKNTVPVSIAMSLPFPAPTFLDLVPSVKNIFNGKNRKLIKAALMPHLIVMRSAQFSADGISIAKQTFDCSSSGITHGGLLKSHHFMSNPWRGQV